MQSPSIASFDGRPSVMRPEAEDRLTESNIEFAALLRGSFHFDPPDLPPMRGRAGNGLDGAGDARRERVDTMTDEARGERKAAGARDASVFDAPDARGLGGYGQRLAAEREHATTQPTPSAPQPSPTGTPDVALRPEVPRTAASHDRAPWNPESAAREPRSTNEPGKSSTPPPAPGFESKPQFEAASHHSARVSDTARAELAPNVESTHASTVVPAGVAGPRAGIDAGGTSTAAPSPVRQIAQILSGRAGETLTGRAPDALTLPRGQEQGGNVSKEAAPSKSSAPSGRPAPESDQIRETFERLVRNIRLQMGERQSTARIRLSPPELGHVRVDLRLRDSRVELRLHAERPEARKLLAERLDSLRAALEQHGLVADRLELTDGRSSTGDALNPERGGAAWADAPGQQAKHGADPDRQPVTEGDLSGEAGAAESGRGDGDLAQEARLDIRI